MLNSVIVLAASEEYRPHAKAVMVNCRRQGGWKGDFCLIQPREADMADLESRGINVLPDSEETCYRKFSLFDPFFTKWDLVLYLDCDVLVQAPLEPLVHELEWGTILADREPFDLMHAFTFFAKPEELKTEAVLNTFRYLWKQYDPGRRQFNTGVLLFHPSTMIPNALQELRSMRDRLQSANSHCFRGSDQPIMNMVFAEQFRTIRSDMVCYWKSAWDKTVVVHTCSDYAPWINKTSDMEAYANEKLGRSYHDVYQENLGLFDKEFPYVK